MANEEALVLDGLALNDGVTFGMLSFDAPVPRQRQDWIGAADSEAQLLVRNPLHENRKITVRMVVVPQASMNVAHDKLLLVLDKLQKASQYPDGIAMTWVPSTGTRTATFDVLSAEITDLPIDWENGWLAFSPQFTVEMTAKPYWRGTETLTSTATSSTPFVTLEVASVTGDVPALGRLIITDTASQSRRHVEWGLEGPLTYSSSTSLLVDSDSLVVTGYSGAQSTLTGAYDPNAAGSSTIIFTVPNGGTTAVCGTGNLTHVGAFRVKARVQVTSITTQFRLTWKANDSAFTSNAWVTAPAANAWCEVDLGVMTIPVASSGTQRWTGQVEALGELLSPGVGYVDYLTLIPVSDGYGKARATFSLQSGVQAAFDSFPSTTAGNALNARVAQAGGTWATSGDATDFVFTDNLWAVGIPESIVRSAGSGTSGRYAILGSASFTDTDVGVTVQNITPTVDQALIARWTDASNHIRLVLPPTYPVYARIEQVVAGVVTVLATSATGLNSGLTVRLRLVTYATGRVIGQVIDNLTNAVLAEISATSTAVATAGTLASGKPGIRDIMTAAGTAARYYGNFNVSVPAAEPIALYSGRNMQVRYDDVYRQDSTGTYAGRPQSYRGSRFLVPVGTSRVLVKARRNDVDLGLDDTVTDALQIQIGYTPRGLAVPR